jgi:hypothetical protein
MLNVSSVRREDVRTLRNQVSSEYVTVSPVVSRGVQNHDWSELAEWVTLCPEIQSEAE